MSDAVANAIRRAAPVGLVAAPRFAMALTVAFTLTGCATTAELTEDQPVGASQGGDRDIDPAADLVLVPRPQASVPTGIDAGRVRAAVTEWSDDSILEMLAAQSARPTDAGVEPTRESVSEADQAEALRLYLRGVDDLVANRALSAVTRLEAASQLDPDQVAVWRRLAQAYEQVGNRAKAQSMYRHVLRLEPDDGRAMLELAFGEANRRDFAAAVTWMARAWDDDQTAFKDDSVGRRLAAYLIHVAADRLGYDRAVIDAGRIAIAQPIPGDIAPRDRGRFSSIVRQLGEILRAMGDAACRLDDLDEALSAYERAVVLPQHDRTSTAARLVYVHLRRGAPLAAQAAFMEHLVDPYGGDVTAERLAVAEWLVGELDDPGPLTDAIADRVEAQSGSGLVRLLALVRPDPRTLAHLEAYLEANPDDLDAVAQVVASVASADPDGAVGLVARLVERRPRDGERYVRRLILALEDPIGAAYGAYESPAGAAVRLSMMTMYWDVGGAWRGLEQALERWPDAPALLRLRIELAGVLDELPLLEDALAAAAHLDDPTTELLRARVLWTKQRFADARESARRAGAHAGLEAIAALELARIEFAEAMLSPPAEHSIRAQRVADLARRALDREPHLDEAWELLANVYSPSGPGAQETGALSNLVRELAQVHPTSAFRRRFLAQLALRRGRSADAIEMALQLYANDPTVGATISLVVAAYESAQQVDRAIEWLEEELAAHPDEPLLNDQLTRLELRSGMNQDAEQRLVEREELNPGDPIARTLLELVATAQGDYETAYRRRKARMMSYPPGTRRALQLASAAGRAGWIDDSIAELTWIAEHTEIAAPDHLTGALSVARALAPDSRADAVTALLVERAVDHSPGLPLQIYGLGLRALSRVGPLDERFSALASRAARESEGADDTTLGGVVQWIHLAQPIADDGYTEAAAVALRARLAGQSVFSSEALAVLTSMIVAADAASADVDDAPLRTISLMNDLEQRGVLAVVMRTPGGRGDLSEVLLWASTIYATVGNDTGAQVLLRKAIAFDPGNAMAKNNLAYLLIDGGDSSDETRIWIEEAGAAEPQDASIVDTVGWLRYKQGRFADEADDEPGALTLLQRALEMSGEPGVEGLTHCGDALWRLGRHEEAERHWRSALELLDDPQHEQEFVQGYGRLQTQGWGLQVVEPSDIYHHQFGPLREQARRRIDAIERGDEPPIAPTFAEHEQESKDAPRE